MVYLCHKCCGLLTEPVDIRIDIAIGGCGCISGYVRDFYKPFSQLDALLETIEHEKRLVAWLTERNSESDPRSILHCKERIASCESVYKVGAILEEHEMDDTELARHYLALLNRHLDNPCPMSFVTELARRINKLNTFTHLDKVGLIVSRQQ